MALDDRLLTDARAAGARLADVERQVLLSRADYHAAVRRLHLAGASLREIADALSLSHQRVQQIVRGAGGSWWTAWRGRRARRDPICSWCGRPPAEVSKLIAGPTVFICDACVEAAERVASEAGGTGDERPTLQPEYESDMPPLEVAGGRSRARCAFCGRRAQEGRLVVAGPANVCGDCLRVCREILDSRAD